jgi:hypothetical protein
VVITIKIPDALYEKYGALNSQNPRHAIEQTLDRYADVGYSPKNVVFAKKDLQELQSLVGQIDSPEDFVEKVRTALSVRIDGLEIPLTESQRKAIETQSKFFNQDQKEFARKQILAGIQKVFGV